jgi:hypothetical protein
VCFTQRLIFSKTISVDLDRVEALHAFEKQLAEKLMLPGLDARFYVGLDPLELIFGLDERAIALRMSASTMM